MSVCVFKFCIITGDWKTVMSSESFLPRKADYTCSGSVVLLTSLQVHKTAFPSVWRPAGAGGTAPAALTCPWSVPASGVRRQAVPVTYPALGFPTSPRRKFKKRNLSLSQQPGEGNELLPNK